MPPANYYLRASMTRMTLLLRTNYRPFTQWPALRMCPYQDRDGGQPQFSMSTL